VDQGHLPHSARSRINYDEPAAFDLRLLVEHVTSLSAGVPVSKPRYSFITHTRVGTEPLNPSSFIVVEGLFALYWPELRSVCDLKIFVDAPEHLRLARRMVRDGNERGRSCDSVRAQYATSVAPMHTVFVEPTRLHADIVLSNDTTPDGAFTSLLAALRARTSCLPSA
jgi:uridine kinase